MKKTIRITAATIAAFLAISASAQLSNNITAIYGNGNNSNGWSTASNGTLQLALRAKDRTTGATPWSVGNVYTFAIGTAPGSPTKALWNWDFSITTTPDTVHTPSVFVGVYRLSFDTDPTAADNWHTVNPITYWGDNSFGYGDTAAGAGVEPPLPTSDYTVVQNSQNIMFSYFGGDPNVAGTYDFRLDAYQGVDALGHLGSPIASTTIRVIVGDGGTGFAPVPEPSTYGIIGAVALVGIVLIRRRKQAASA